MPNIKLANFNVLLGLTITFPAQVSASLQILDKQTTNPLFFTYCSEWGFSDLKVLCDSSGWDFIITLIMAIIL